MHSCCYGDNNYYFMLCRCSDGIDRFRQEWVESGCSTSVCGLLQYYFNITLYITLIITTNAPIVCPGIFTPSTLAAFVVTMQNSK